MDGNMEKNEVVLSVSCASSHATRATMVGNSNENYIETLHYFFYTEGKTNLNAVESGSILVNKHTETNLRIEVDKNKTILNNLFPNSNTTCQVYIIANLPAGIQLPANTSIESLKAMVINTNFENPQESFIMDGQATVTLAGRDKTLAASGNVLLDRLAAKLTLNINAQESYIDEYGDEWKSDVDLIELTLGNIVMETTLGGEMQNLVHYASRTISENEVQTFYSYPRVWNFRNPNALAFFIKLPVSCTKNGNTRYENCYYKVFPNTVQLDRNNWYHMDLNIGVMGSFSDTEDPVEIEANYKVLDWNKGQINWGSGLNMETELLGARYLVVNKTYYEVNNQSTFEIPFMSSHTCDILDAEPLEIYFGTTSNPRCDTLEIEEGLEENWITLVQPTESQSQKYLRLYHPLKKMGTNNDDYDFAPYIFNITIGHSDNHNFRETITIVQYPPLSIAGQVNSNYTSSNLTNGYHFVNGQSGSSADFGQAPGANQSKNPYMYVISTSVLSDDSEYILGDPRMSVSVINPPETDDSMVEYFTENVFNNEFFNVLATPTRTDNRKSVGTLDSYYPTIKDASVNNMISPKFRIASSYGTCGGFVDYDDAVRRCATYQEDGYPAGRWRVPTVGEVQFMIRLSNDGLIPELFSSSVSYWCSDATCIGTSSNRVVRCVYDEWYWEKSQIPRLTDKNKFTWGDEY